MATPSAFRAAAAAARTAPPGRPPARSRGSARTPARSTTSWRSPPPPAGSPAPARTPSGRAGPRRSGAAALGLGRVGQAQPARGRGGLARAAAVRLAVPVLPLRQTRIRWKERQLGGHVGAVQVGRADLDRLHPQLAGKEAGQRRLQLA